MKQYLFFLILFLNIFTHDYEPEKDNTKEVVPINYDLTRPDKRYILPPALREISGITEFDPATIGCIQDENGILFIYDLMKEKITKQLTFYENGDYEGIARADKTVYVLRSDGMLFEINNYGSSNPVTKSYTTTIPFRDNEGLCFDQKTNNLLIAPKSDQGKESGNKDKRFIYSFDLNSKKLEEKPLFVFDLSVIKKFASENKIKVPLKKDKKGDKNNEPDIEFRTSAIAIHPFTNKIYLLSGMEKLLFVFDMEGEIEFIETLDKELFTQPEGITFLKNGDMLISNEGRNKNPTILRFNYLKK
jgi:hypothetical protein